MRQFGKLFFLEYREGAFDANQLTFFGALRPVRDRRAFRRPLSPARGPVRRRHLERHLQMMHIGGPGSRLESRISKPAPRPAGPPG
jgi:hypothetical protein